MRVTRRQQSAGGQRQNREREMGERVEEGHRGLGAVLRGATGQPRGPPGAARGERADVYIWEVEKDIQVKRGRIYIRKRGKVEENKKTRRRGEKFSGVSRGRGE